MPKCPPTIARILVVVAVVVSAAAADPPATGPAEPGYVTDDAHLFGRQAVADAEAALGRLDRQYHKEFVIETFPAVPEADRAEVARDKAGYFRRWMVARFAARNVNGVYVLVCMDPTYFKVTVGRQTLARGVFTAADLDGLSRQMMADLRVHRYDAALAGAVDRVARAYATNLAGAAAGGGDPTPGP